MKPDWYSSWVLYAYAFTWAPFALSTVLYATRSPWRVTAVGRALMTLLGAMTAVLTFVLVAIIFELPFWAINILRGLTLGGVGISGWMFLRELLVLQRSARTVKPCPKRRHTDVP